MKVLKVEKARVDVTIRHRRGNENVFAMGTRTRFRPLQRPDNTFGTNHASVGRKFPKDGTISTEKTELRDGKNFRISRTK